MRAAVSLLTLAFFGPVAAGCISNEYIIPPEELNRLVATPPDVRGEQVHVVQELGSRRTDPVPTDGPAWGQQAAPWPQPQAWQEPYAEGETPDPYAEGERRDTDVEGNVNINVNIGGGGQPAEGRSGSWRGTPRASGPSASGGGWQGRPVTPSGGGWQGHPSPSGGSVTGWRGSPPSGPGGGWHGVPSPGGHGGGSSGGGGNWLGGGSSGGGGGGSGGGGDVLVVVAIVLAAVAVIAAIGLVSSEGVRYDGLAQMSPWQPVHLKQSAGDELVIALGDLSPVALRNTVEAKVMDDEGYGIRRLGHLPISRVWMPTFKLDGGSMTFARTGDIGHSGIVANVQGGVFIRPWLGLLLTATVGGASDQYGATLARHTFGLEAQSLPLALGPVRIGGYADLGGAAISSTLAGSGGVEWGKAIGGGLLTELELTGRLALTFRAGANEAFFADSGTTSAAATITGGIAVY